MPLAIEAKNWVFLWVYVIDNFYNECVLNLSLTLSLSLPASRSLWSPIARHHPSHLLTSIFMGSHSPSPFLTHELLFIYLFFNSQAMMISLTYYAANFANDENEEIYNDLLLYT